MAQTLFTNSKLSGRNFKDEFKARLENSNELIIASGYFGASSIVEYQDDILRLSETGVCKILIGMIFHGGLTKKQQDVLVVLDEKLRAINLSNGVYVSIKPYHGKIYLFSDSANNKSLYLGSSNFSEEGFASRHECTALIEHEKTKSDVTDYLTHLFDIKIAKPLNKVQLRVKKLSSPIPLPSKLLEDYEVPFADYPDKAAALGVFDIELRVDSQPNSSLNLYFDKGRINPKTQLYAPRPWYEVEITSCKSDTNNPFYPKSELLQDRATNSRSGQFVAYAEDGGKYYKFNMAVYSASGKAISTSRESGGRETLGKFIKGKLERKGCLTEGQRITSDTLAEYGRSSIGLSKIKDGVYILEF